MPLGTFLSNDNPSTLRGLLFLSLTELGQVGTRQGTDDGGGGTTETWMYSAQIPCRIDPLNGNEVLSAERISDRSTHLITTPPGTVVDTNGRFQIAGRGTFEITAVQQQTGEMATFFEAVEVT